MQYVILLSNKRHYKLFMQKRVLLALEDAGVFTSGGLVKDKVLNLCCFDFDSIETTLIILFSSELLKYKFGECWASVGYVREFLTLGIEFLSCF